MRLKMVLAAEEGHAFAFTEILSDAEREVRHSLVEAEYEQLQIARAMKGRPDGWWFPNA